MESDELDVLKGIEANTVRLGIAVDATSTASWTIEQRLSLLDATPVAIVKHMIKAFSLFNTRQPGKWHELFEDIRSRARPA